MANDEIDGKEEIFNKFASDSDKIDLQRFAAYVQEASDEQVCIFILTITTTRKKKTVPILGTVGTDT